MAVGREAGKSLSVTRPQGVSAPSLLMGGEADSPGSPHKTIVPGLQKKEPRPT